MVTRAQRALIKSRRRNAVRAKREADAKALGQADIIPEEDEEEKQSGPGTSRGPKKFNPKDLLAALAELPAAALGAIVAGSLVAAISAGAVSIDGQLDTGNDRVALQQIKDKLDLLPEDTVDILTQSRGLRPEVETLQAQMANMQGQMLDFAEQMARIKLNAVTPSQLSSINSSIGNLKNQTSANSLRIDQTTGDLTNLGEDLGAIRGQVNMIADDVVRAQETAIDAAESATLAQTEANRATTSANGAQEAANEALVNANALAAELAEAKIRADQLANDIATAKSTADQAAADVLVAQAAAEQAIEDAATSQATADQAIEDAATAQAAADEALTTAELALKKIPVVSTDVVDRTATGTQLNHTTGGPAIAGTYFVQGSAWYTSGCGSVRLLDSSGVNILANANIQTVRDGNIVTVRGTIALPVGAMGWQFIGTGCRMQSPILSLSFIS